MKIKEYLAHDNIFTTIINETSLPINPELLNGILVVEHGEKTLFSKLEGVPVSTAGEYITALHGENWARLIELNSIYEVVKNGDTNERKEIVKITENRENLKNDKGLISAYDSDELVINDGGESSGSDLLDGERITTVKESKVSLNSLYFNLSLSQKNAILQTVVKDVANFLAINIY